MQDSGQWGAESGGAAKEGWSSADAGGTQNDQQMGTASAGPASLLSAMWQPLVPLLVPLILDLDGQCARDPGHPPADTWQRRLVPSRASWSSWWRGGDGTSSGSNTGCGLSPMPAVVHEGIGVHNWRGDEGQ
jgi:hypothetical protein